VPSATPCRRHSRSPRPSPNGQAGSRPPDGNRRRSRRPCHQLAGGYTQAWDMEDCNGHQRSRQSSKEPQVRAPTQRPPGSPSGSGPEFESPHLHNAAQWWAPPWHRGVVPWLAPTIVGFGGAARHRRPASPTECATTRLAGYATTSEAARSLPSRLALAARVARTTPLSRGGRPR
jgi:hypothetical protein